MIVPLFSTAASRRQGGSFTVEKAGDKAKMGRKRGPVSLCDLAKAEGLKRMWLVESSFVNFMSAAKNLAEVGCALHFGLKLTVCADAADKTEASFKTESKVVVWMAGDGSTDYVRLCQLFTKANEGFYYVPRVDWKTLCAMWGDDLLLTLPFYSSFLARNTLTFSSIVPEMPCQPLLLREVKQGHPHDGLINAAIDRYVEATKAPVRDVKSVYYPTRKLAGAFLCWRAALERNSTFSAPNMDQMCSREFSWEAYRELEPANGGAL